MVFSTNIAPSMMIIGLILTLIPFSKLKRLEDEGGKMAGSYLQYSGLSTGFVLMIIAAWIPFKSESVSNEGELFFVGVMLAASQFVALMLLFGQKQANMVQAGVSEALVGLDISGKDVGFIRGRAASAWRDSYKEVQSPEDILTATRNAAIEAMENAPSTHPVNQGSSRGTLPYAYIVLSLIVLVFLFETWQFTNEIISLKWYAISAALDAGIAALMVRRIKRELAITENDHD